MAEQSDNASHVHGSVTATPVCTHRFVSAMNMPQTPLRLILFTSASYRSVKEPRGREV
eukprot:CAMPEP_0174696510 /NCGR_PEP_ID=MMETSP1094-20130205/2636_1 /TAXON_ID=156173 /ORGANISM="Chrysochromulina brevifilum, Strain UTEX LB 985" /LENGTH=57 /DNA_ID=CAMNT_0015893291 /DNA_START=227 /DNA_END=400 /DNA_ORIENTATION=-